MNGIGSPRNRQHGIRIKTEMTHISANMKNHFLILNESDCTKYHAEQTKKIVFPIAPKWRRKARERSCKSVVATEKSRTYPKVCVT